MNQKIFEITNVKHYMSPGNLNMDEMLKSYGVAVDILRKAILNKKFQHKNTTKGFQIELASELKNLLSQVFHNNGAHEFDGRYSSTMQENSDFAFRQKDGEKSIFGEIEFRPNEHKDVVKFLIAYRNGSLDLGILLVAVDWKNINPDYYTMPRYDKCKQTIAELRDECPILLIGIDGHWLE